MRAVSSGVEIKWNPPDRVGYPSKAEDKSPGTHGISARGTTSGAVGSLRFGRDDINEY